MLIRSVAVLGAGTMGAQIAAHFANAGIPAVLLDVSADASPTAMAIAAAARKHATEWWSVIGYFFFPSGPNCLTYAQRSPISFSSLMPANIIFVFGILARGSLTYSRNVSSLHVRSEFLSPSL